MKRLLLTLIFVPTIAWGADSPPKVYHLAIPSEDASALIAALVRDRARAAAEYQADDNAIKIIQAQAMKEETAPAETSMNAH